MDSTSSSTSLNMDSDSICSSGRKAIKEGAVQMTSLSSLVVFHRYFFLYNDALIVSKQKGVAQFKLKEKHQLSSVWVAVHHPSDTSFLLGWPLHNFLVHFRSREERDDWFGLFSSCIQKCTRPVTTTIPMHIHVRGRKQVIRRRVTNGKKTGELIVETAADLGLPSNSYELRVSVGENHGKALQGPENVYAVIMHRIDRSGVRLSESQRQALDACPFAQIKLILSTMKTNHTPTPMQIMNSIRKKVLHRSDSRGFIGRDLDGPTPPQPIMTIVDHLRMKGFDSEGIFRKSPKQSTFKELRGELERGVVPDFNRYSTHVLASMLKEYLRGIPGKILQSSNYELWMREVVDEPETSKKISAAAALVKLLPSSHAILLANVLKLLSKIASSPASKMTSSALSVCLAPSFLESPDPIEGGKKIPLLVEFLIENAVEIVPGFCSDNVFSVLHSVDLNANLVCSPSFSDDDAISQKTPIIEEIAEDNTSTSSIAVSSNWSEPNEPEPPLNFFSSDDEDEPSARPLSFLSDTLRSNDTIGREKKEERTASVAKEEKEKTPRSPCLKRIHFQRTEAQLRSSEMFQSRADFKFNLVSSRKNSVEKQESRISSEPPSRKESREEATQTPDCLGILPLAVLPSNPPRFPAFKSNIIVAENPNSAEAGAVFTKAAVRSEEKPMLHVQPFSQERETHLSPEPSLQSISERLAALRERSRVDAPESPKFLRKLSATAITQQIPENTMIPAKPVYKPVESLRTPELHRAEALVKAADAPKPKVITEKFSPYCLEPKEFVQEKKTDILRTSSQRGDKQPEPRELRELQRASSVRCSARRADRACVGMEPMEINWSVRQLSSLFQDSRVPSIDTDYNYPY